MKHKKKTTNLKSKFIIIMMIRREMRGKWTRRYDTKCMYFTNDNKRTPPCW